MKYADVDASTDAYARRFAGGIGAWLLERQSQLVRALVCQARASTANEPFALVDVGGGHGQIARAFAPQRQPSLTVLGSDETCSSQVRDLVAMHRVRFEAGDLLRSPFGDQSFEVVTCIRLLPHCDEWRELIGELCRLSRQAVIVDYPPLVSSNIFYPVLFRIKHALEGNTRTFRLFHHAEVQAEFARHGFTLTRREGQFFFPMVMHRMLRSPKLSAALELLPQVLGLQRVLGNPVVALFTRDEK